MNDHPKKMPSSTTKPITATQLILLTFFSLIGIFCFGVLRSLFGGIIGLVSGLFILFQLFWLFVAIIGWIVWALTPKSKP
jgi:hypothetical protein